MKASFLFSVLMMLLSLKLFSQNPEHDCKGAIEVTTSPEIFTGDDGYGHYQEIDYNSNSTCLMNGEQNSTWLKFTICNAGILKFQLASDTSSVDLDFALYDMTNDSCTDGDMTGIELRCNFSGILGPTGLEEPYTNISSLCWRSTSVGSPECSNRSGTLFTGQPSI